MTWLIWAIVLLMQNASFTLVSRARNSASIPYHAIASVLSNGIWFVSQFFVIGIITRAQHESTLAIIAGLFYVLLTTISAVGMHWFLMRKVEGRINARA